jgi:hypothetical protein
MMADNMTMSILNCNLYIHFRIVKSIVLAKFVEQSEAFYWIRRCIAIYKIPPLARIHECSPHANTVNS